MIYHNYSHLKFFWLNVFGLIYSTLNIFAAYMLSNLINMATKRQFSALPSLMLQIIVALTIILISGLLFNYLKTDAVKQINTKLRSKVLKGDAAK